MLNGDLRVDLGEEAALYRAAAAAFEANSNPNAARWLLAAARYLDEIAALLPNTVATAVTGERS